MKKIARKSRPWWTRQPHRRSVGPCVEGIGGRKVVSYWVNIHSERNGSEGAIAEVQITNHRSDAEALELAEQICRRPALLDRLGKQLGVEDHRATILFPERCPRTYTPKHPELKLGPSSYAIAQCWDRKGRGWSDGYFVVYHKLSRKLIATVQITKDVPPSRAYHKARRIALATKDGAQ